MSSNGTPVVSAPQIVQPKRIVSHRNYVLVANNFSIHDAEVAQTVRCRTSGGVELNWNRPREGNRQLIDSVGIRSRGQRIDERSISARIALDANMVVRDIVE